MDLEALWQQHKRFMVQVGAGAVAFTVLSAGVAGIEASADSYSKRNARDQQELLAQISENLRGKEGVERGKKIALEDKAAKDILASVTWTVDRSYILGEADAKNSSIAYLKRTASAAEDVGRHADKAGTILPRKAESRLPDLSFEDGANLEGARAAEAVARCDLTRRVMNAAIDAGVTKFLAVRQPEATYQPLEGGAGFLRRIPVSLTFEAGAQELAKLLLSFQQEGSFLELGACHVTRGKDARPEDGRLDIELELGALTVEKEQPDDAKSPSDENKGGRKPPRRRRD
jgi:hypothetical protein